MPPRGRGTHAACPATKYSPSPPSRGRPPPATATPLRGLRRPCVSRADLDPRPPGIDGPHTADAGRAAVPGHGVDVSGPLAFVVGGPDSAWPEDGLTILDVGHPARPARVGGLVLPGARAVAVAGRRAAVALDGGGVSLVDVSYPKRPVEVACARLAACVDWAALEGVLRFSRPARIPSNPKRLPGSTTTTHSASSSTRFLLTIR